MGRVKRRPAHLRPRKRRESPRQESQLARVREITGKYRGLVTVAEFISAKRRDARLEP